MSFASFDARFADCFVACFVAAALALSAGAARAEAPSGYEVPTAGLVHGAVATGRRGGPVAITVGVQSDLAFDTLVLAYRGEGEADFRRREMKLVAPGTYRAEIPSSATAAPSVAYYVEAEDKDGSPVAGRGSPGSPLVVELVGPPPTMSLPRESPQEDEEDEPLPARRFYVAVLAGSGAGWATGNGDTNADTRLSPSRFALAQLGQLAPELGVWVAPRLMISVQGRFQAVLGTTDVHADGRVYHGATYAAAAFAKATWFSGASARLHPFFSFALGGGQIRHVVTFKELAACGPSGGETCVDTISAGPIAVGPGGGVMADLNAAFAVVLQVNTQLTFPAFTFNVDGNVGAAVRF